MHFLFLLQVVGRFSNVSLADITEKVSKDTTRYLIRQTGEKKGKKKVQEAAASFVKTQFRPSFFFFFLHCVAADTGTVKAEQTAAGNCL